MEGRDSLRTSQNGCEKTTNTRWEKGKGSCLRPQRTAGEQLLEAGNDERTTNEGGPEGAS